MPCVGAAGDIPARPGAARERSAGTELHLGVRERLASARLVPAGTGPPPRAQSAGDHGQPSPRRARDWVRLGALGAQDEGQPNPAPSASLETQPGPGVAIGSEIFRLEKTSQIMESNPNLTVPGPSLNDVPKHYSYMHFLEKSQP